MKRLPSWSAWLIVAAAIVLAAVLRIGANAGNWVWALAVVAFLAVGMTLGDGDGESGDSDDSAASGDSGGDSGGGGD